MKSPTKIAAKRLKRKTDAQKKLKRQLIASGKIIIFGGRMFVRNKKKVASKEKPKVVKPLPAYRAVKLTAKLDELVTKIRDMDPNDPKLVSLKQRRDIIKKKLNQK